MGATASSFYYSSLPPSQSPSPPAKCSLWETRSTTRLFTVPDYSNWVQMAAGSALLFDDTIHLLDLGYNLKVYPAGYDKKAGDYVAMFNVMPQCKLASLIQEGRSSGQEAEIPPEHTKAK